MLLSNPFGRPVPSDAAGTAEDAASVTRFLDTTAAEI